MIKEIINKLNYNNIDSAINRLGLRLKNKSNLSANDSTGIVFSIIHKEINDIWRLITREYCVDMVYKLPNKPYKTGLSIVRQFVYEFVCKLEQFKGMLNDKDYINLSEMLIRGYPNYIFYNEKSKTFINANYIYSIINIIVKYEKESNMDKIISDYLAETLNYRLYILSDRRRSRRFYFQFIKDSRSTNTNFIV